MRRRRGRRLPAGGAMRRLPAACAVLLVWVVAADARQIRNLYRTAPALVGLGSLAADERYQNAADVILEQAIRNLPLFPAASSAYTYRWNAGAAPSNASTTASRPSTSSAGRRSAKGC